VLVHVRQACEIRCLRERSVLYIDFDCRQWNAVVFNDDDLQTIGQDFSLNDLFQLGALSCQLTRRSETHQSHDGQSGAPEVVSVSL